MYSEVPKLKKFYILLLTIIIFLSNAISNANRYYDTDDIYSSDSDGTGAVFFLIIFLLFFWKYVLRYIFLISIILTAIFFIFFLVEKLGLIGLIIGVVCIYFICKYFIDKDEKNHIKKTPILIYTDKEKNKYYLCEYYSAARTWEFARVMKKRYNDGLYTELVFRFSECCGVDYSLYYGNSTNFDKRNFIESGFIENNSVAKIIWNDYLKNIHDEKWRKINEYERTIHEDEKN